MRVPEEQNKCIAQIRGVMKGVVMRHIALYSIVKRLSMRDGGKIMDKSFREINSSDIVIFL